MIATPPRTALSVQNRRLVSLERTVPEGTENGDKAVPMQTTINERALRRTLFGSKRRPADDESAALESSRVPRAGEDPRAACPNAHVRRYPPCQG